MVGHNDNDKVQLPGYDARLQYYDILKNHLEVLAIASYSNNYSSWLTSLRILLYMTGSYMTTDQHKEILQKIKIAENYYQTYILSSRTIIERLLISHLQDATSLIHRYAKHMFLPGGATGNDADLSMEEFFRGSDL